VQQPRHHCPPRGQGVRQGVGRGAAHVGAAPRHPDDQRQKALLFGPYAGFSTKFLKNGSYLDLPLSIKANNLRPMLAAGIDNIPLTRYLIDQVLQSPKDRLSALREYFPNADAKDWELEVAGQRVQVIKKDPIHGGILEFGTEVVSAADGSIAALLGASPGASTAVTIMLNLLSRCFKDQYGSTEWQTKIKLMIPSFGESLNDDAELCHRIRAYTAEALGLQEQASLTR
jgi:malate dehydrogenase (quinone)